MMEYYNNYKNNIYKSSKELDISETVSILKQNQENQIDKTFQNKLDDYYESFEPVVKQVDVDLERLKAAKAAEVEKDKARSAQEAINEQIAKDALEMYMQQKKAENEPYRASRSASRSEVNKDQDNSLDNDNTYRPFN